MPTKRKAAPLSSAPTPKRIASAASTPKPQNDDDDDEYLANDDDDNNEEGFDDEEDEAIEKLVDKFNDIGTTKFYAHDAVTHLFNGRDYSHMPLKPDHHIRPLWINPISRRIIAESFSPRFKDAESFLINVAEPLSRVSLIHEYTITSHSLFAAASVGLTTDSIIRQLEEYSKTPIPDLTQDFIRKATQSFGKVRLVLKHNKYWAESDDPAVLRRLLRDSVISDLRNSTDESLTTANAPQMAGLVISGTKLAAGAKQAGTLAAPAPAPTASTNPTNTKNAESTDQQQNLDDIQAALLDDEDDDNPEAEVYSFEIPPESVQSVRRRCKELELPLTEEYDFRADEVNPNLKIDLKPIVQIRPYQEKALHKMFSNGRARSGIIVLPCGAGKTLVGITAACTVNKSVLVLCTSAMSVFQWKTEFERWSDIPPENIATFTSKEKNVLRSNVGVVISTYSMISRFKSTNYDTKRVMDSVQGREWGLMILDEVHVVPAEMFKKVTWGVKAHSKLGLTATLLREDDKITELNFLIGPKLYEANWQELSAQGHIARVQCAEVWCPMTSEFYSEYLKARNTPQRNLLATMNPRKFQALQFLVDHHSKNGDKIIVFSDNIYALRTYAQKLGAPWIEGKTQQHARQKALDNFQFNPRVNTLFLSKIGDTSLDLPEATCLIQVSSHFGSRRQEAQRLGRILRAKRRNDEGFNAFFYTLISKDTEEMFYASKRQAFLVDQGYAFKVITQLQGLATLPTLAYTTPQERRELLADVLLACERDEAGAEEIEDDLFSAPHPGAGGKPRKNAKKKGRGMAKIKRVGGMLADLSGGQTMAYVETSRSKPKEIAQGSAFMKKLKRAQEKKRTAAARPVL